MDHRSVGPLMEMFRLITQVGLQDKDLQRVRARRLIEGGGNPYLQWRRHFGASRRNVARALGIDLREYRTIEANMYQSEPRDVLLFCQYFKLSPVDLMNDIEMVPTSLATVLAEVAADAQGAAQANMAAREAVLREIGKVDSVFMQVRAQLRSFGPQSEIMRLPQTMMSQLTLAHPVVNAMPGVPEYADVLDIAQDFAEGAREMHAHARAELRLMSDPACGDGRVQRLRQEQMCRFWTMICDEQDPAVGYRLERSIADKGLAFTRRTFMQDPEFYGAQEWPSLRRVYIDGDIYDWTGANARFFDLLAAWRAHELVGVQWQEQARAMKPQIAAFDDWMERDLTQDVLQGFSNICLFDKVLGGDAQVRAALEPFRPQGRTAVQNRVFTGFKPC